MPVDLGFWVFACAATLVAGVSKGGFGGGPAMLATPLFALGSDPVTAAAVMLPVLCFMDMLGLRAWWRQANWADIKLLLPAAMLGIVIGGLLFRSLNPAVLLCLLGGLALSFSLWQVSGGARVSNPGPWIARLCGGVGGLSSTIAHAGGPPVAVYLLSRELTAAA
ncbi:MAG: TSUP family transporter, partial [Granulosicoccaceae bacterium]